MDISKIIAMINKAVTLYDQASDLFEKVKPSIDNITDGDKSDSLEEAYARLNASMERARDAHSDLDAAIAAKLNK